MKTSQPGHWQTLFSLWSLQGIAALGWLVAIPTDADHPLAFGFSAARLVLIGAAILLTVISMALWLQSRRITFRQTWLKLDERSAFWDLTYLTALLLIIAAAAFIILVPLFKSGSLYPVYAA